jgi:signal transduction histidine kinase
VAVRATVQRPLPTVRGDGVRLRQVVSNLIDNAVKYSDAGAEVEVEVATLNSDMLVRVRDHGPGIPRDQQRLIFEKFGRVRGSSKPGSGLGLFIARSIAEAHGGSVEVRSVPGEGSTFTLSLPVDGEAA